MVCKGKIISTLLIFLFITFFIYSNGLSQTPKEIQDIREYLIRLVEGQKALNQRIDELDKSLGLL